MTPEIEALLERLRDALRRTDSEGFSPEVEQTLMDDLPTLFDTIEALTRELAVKDEALRPFANVADWKESGYSFALDDRIACDVNLGDCRRAHAALTPKASADEQEIG